MNYIRQSILIFSSCLLFSCAGNSVTNSREVTFFGRLVYVEYDINSRKEVKDITDSRKELSGDIEICFDLKKTKKVKCNKFDSKYLQSATKKDPTLAGKNVFMFKDTLQDISLKSISLNNGADKFAFDHDAAKISNIITNAQMVYLGDILMYIDTNYRDSEDYNNKYKHIMNYDEYKQNPKTATTNVMLMSGCNENVVRKIESSKGIKIHSNCFEIGVEVTKLESPMMYFLVIPKVK